MILTVGAGDPLGVFSSIGRVVVRPSCECDGIRPIIPDFAFGLVLAYFVGVKLEWFPRADTRIRLMAW